MSSADLTVHTMDWELSLMQSFFWKKICASASYANHILASFIPSGTHYGRVNRGTEGSLPVISVNDQGGIINKMPVNPSKYSQEVTI